MRRRLLLAFGLALVAGPARTQAADAVVDAVERRLRRPLAPGERRVVTDAVLAWSRSLRSLARRFAADVAALAGLRPGQVAALVPDIADPFAVRALGPEIEALRDRALSARQRQRLADLDSARRTEVDVLDRRLVDALVGVGLDPVGAARTLAAVRGR